MRRWAQWWSGSVWALAARLNPLLPPVCLSTLQQQSLQPSDKIACITVLHGKGSAAWQDQGQNFKKKGEINKSVWMQGDDMRWGKKRKQKLQRSRESKGIQNGLKGEREIRKKWEKKAGTLSSWVTHCRATAAPSHLWSALHWFHSTASDTLSNEHSHSHYGSWEAGTDAAAKQAKIHTDAVTRQCDTTHRRVAELSRADSGARTSTLKRVLSR